MVTLIDGKKEKERFHAKRKRYLVAFFLLSALVLAAVIVGVIFAPDDYLWTVIALIVIVTLYSWFSLLMMLGPYQVVKDYDRFFSSLLNGLPKTEVLQVEGVTGEGNYSKNNIRAQILNTSFTEDGKRYERNVYVILSDLDLPKGTIVKATTFSSVLISYEVISHD